MEWITEVFLDFEALWQFLIGQGFEFWFMFALFYMMGAIVL